MRKILLILLRLAAGLLLLVAGCKGSQTVACYGVPPADYDPDVKVASFSYAPAGPVRVGDELVFTATLTKQVDPFGAAVNVFTGEPVTLREAIDAGNHLLYLNDLGEGPDLAARDGIWTGAVEWPAGRGPQSGLPVYARLSWYDGMATDVLQALPLTILPAEDGQE